MENNPVLIVEDDNDLREALAETLELSGFQNITAESGAAAIKLLDEMQPSLIVSDVQMDDIGGFELLNVLQRRIPNVPVILMTAYSNVNDAVSAMRNGAVDYVTKPFETNVLIEKIQHYMPLSLDGSIEPIAEDPKSKQLLSLALRVAEKSATVLIGGESGTGKEVLARYIHDHSTRADKPFIAINCAAIPENMLEATLFGYEKGAFTGAYKSTPGKFEQAQGGTLLLDEISEMDLALQAKLLRVLQEKELERLGGQKTISLDVRVLATSNRNMKDEVFNGRFREDLYYRLNVFPLYWSPLRERPLDILPMAEYLLKQHTAKNKQQALTLTENAKKALQHYDWPGNARELDNVIQRALILQSGELIDVDDLQLDERHLSIAKESAEEKKENLSNDLKSREFDIILSTLSEFNGNRKETAKKLGISERTLRYKLAKIRETGIEI